LGNPFSILTQLRSEGAIVPVEVPGNSNRFGYGPAWIVTRYAEAAAILKDHKHFTVNANAASSSKFLETREKLASEAPAFFSGNSMLSVDEPDHMRLRGLVSKAFTPAYINSLRPRIQQLADELLNKVQDRGSMELVHDYAYPLPINVISEMLGIPENNRIKIKAFSEALSAGTFRTPENEKFIMEKIKVFSDYIIELVTEKRSHPQDDLISQLINQEEKGDRLNEGELLSMVSLLVVAGHETTSNLIGIGTLMLFDNPEQLEKLKKDTSLIPQAVEELLRFNGPVMFPITRFATEDIIIAGQQIKNGDTVFIALTSANRDERQFLNPDQLDLTRQEKQHIAFGTGIHMCIGAPLARLEGEIAFETLLRRMPHLRLNIPRDSVTWRGNFTLRGLISLPVSF
jgi:cytochrome P450